MEDRTIEIKLLKHLAAVKEIDYCDILNHYFLEYYKETNTKELADSVQEVLWYLSFDNNYIKFEEENFPIGDLGKPVNYNSEKTVLTLDFAKTWWKQGIKTKITPAGRHYLSEIVRSEKQDVINETLKTNSNVQKKTAIAVGIFTVLNVIIAGITLYQNATKRTEQEKSIQVLTDSLNSLKSQEKLNQTEYLLFQKAVKDSLKSISERTK